MATFPEIHAKDFKQWEREFIIKLRHYLNNIKAENLILDSKLVDIADLVDPNADRILFWDDSAGEIKYLTAGSGLTITATTLTRNDTFGNVSGGHYSEFESDGTLKFNGDATVYDDLQFTVSAGKVPAVNTPTWEAFTANTSEYSFAVDDYIDLPSKELPHSWQLGTTVDIHAHITTKDANATGSNRYAKFTVYVAYCDTGETWQETSFPAELTIPTGTAALTMFYLDMGDLTLTNYVLGAEIKCRIKRIAATGGTEYASNIFVTQVGAHFKADTAGSRQEATK